MRNNSDVIAGILNPESQKNSRKKGRNHHRDYLQNLREIQNENRRFKQKEDYLKNRKDFKLAKFRNVPSVLKSELQELDKEFQKRKDQFEKLQGDESVSNLIEKNDDDIVVNVVSQEATEQKSSFLRRGTNKERQKSLMEKRKMQNKENALLDELEREKRGEKASQTLKKKRIPNIPKEQGELKPRESKNFLRENYQTAVKPETKKKPLVQKAETKHQNFGKVPSYLKKRKERWEQDERMAQAIAQKRKDCPPGMQLMETSERLETLKVLEENKRKINDQIMRMPIVIDTLGLRKRKAQLEEKLAEVESAIKLFSRDRVFIAQQ